MSRAKLGNIRGTKARIITLLFFALPCIAQAQAPISYRLRYLTPGDCCVRIQIHFTGGLKAPVALVMPRTYPGCYEQILYDAFVEKVSAFDTSGEIIEVNRAEDGPRWNIGTSKTSVERIEYEVDIARMEKTILASVETSKVRNGYAGLLGYSIFGYVDGLESRPIKLAVEAPEHWPVLATLAHRLPPPLTMTEVEASDFYALADSQILMGPELQTKKAEGKIPLVLAVYGESPINLDIEAGLAHEALNDVQAYFGDIPFRQYTVQLEFFKPLAGHDYNFSQEHIDSGTFSFSVDWIMSAKSTAEQRESVLVNYAHHMAHSWIPKRAYSTGYLPFTWELAPVIDTIWFNEGFGRYAGIEAIAQAMPRDEAASFREKQLVWLRRILVEAPPFIQKMSLCTLSREASFLYAVDFRLGKSIFARGALMAAEMDERIRSKTHNGKNLSDALHALLAWSDANHKPFTLEDMMQTFFQGTGADVRDILQRWQEPLWNENKSSGPNLDSQ